jgi:uncharacterized protein (DUF433 family)
METKRRDHLETTPGVCGGKPRIVGTRITVKDVVLMHLKMGQPLAQIAGTYDFALSSAHEAMAYYYDHREDVDRMIAEDAAYVEALKTEYPSLLQQKLGTLRVA